MTFWFPDGSGPAAPSEPAVATAEVAGARVAAFRAAPIDRVRICQARAPGAAARSTHCDNDIAPTAAGGLRLSDGALA